MPVSGTVVVVTEETEVVARISEVFVEFEFSGGDIGTERGSGTFDADGAGSQVGMGIFLPSFFMRAWTVFGSGGFLAFQTGQAV